MTFGRFGVIKETRNRRNAGKKKKNGIRPISGLLKEIKKTGILPETKKMTFGLFWVKETKKQASVSPETKKNDIRTILGVKGDTKNRYTAEKNK